MTRYTLTFSATNARYSCHAANCRAALNPGRGRHGPFGDFATLVAARDYADRDESEKAGESVRASWKVCPCTKGE